MTDVNPDDPFVVHEVFHAACVLMETWEEQVSNHIALRNKPHVKAMAAEAFSQMHDVYAALGLIRDRQGAWSIDDRDADPFARDRERAAKVRAATVLHSAADIIGGDRAEQHGPMAVSFGRIAMMWHAYLQVRRDVDEPLTGEDVAHMMVLMKQVRSQSGEWNLDDFVDLCGYGACAAELSSPQV